MFDNDFPSVVIGWEFLLVEIFGASLQVCMLYYVYGLQEFTVIKCQILLCQLSHIINLLFNKLLPFSEDVSTIDFNEPPTKLSTQPFPSRCIIDLVFDILSNGVYGLLLHGLDEDVSAAYEECFLLFRAMTPHNKDHPLFAGILPFLTPSLKSGHDELVLLIKNPAIRKLCSHCLVPFLSLFLLFCFFINDSLLNLICLDYGSFDFILRV